MLKMKMVPSAPAVKTILWSGDTTICVIELKCALMTSISPSMLV